MHDDGGILTGEGFKAGSRLPPHSYDLTTILELIRKASILVLNPIWIHNS
jgi:hypothetical protein